MTTTSIVEFLLLLLIAASLIALVTIRLKIPYTVALVIGGVAIDLFHVPIREILGEGAPAGVLTPDVIFILFLPGLLFESGINVQVGYLRENLLPITLLAVAGVLIAAVVTGCAVHWALGVPLTVALVFGALISATDPISVLALFKDMGVNRRLAVLMEGESLFNDGTAVVVFQILAAGALTGSLSLAAGFTRFLIVSLGGAVLGLLLGYAVSKITGQVDNPSIEITLTTILAYGSYLLAEHLHVSGVIATVGAGLMVGNYGAAYGMSARTRVALWSFWEYFAFVINSLVFLLIGIEVHVADLIGFSPAILVAIGVVLLARALTVYSLTPVSNRFARAISWRWRHVLVWGGLHGGVSMALALSLGEEFPYRRLILAMTFGVVAFSIIVQGLTMKPLVRRFGLVKVREHVYDRLKVSQAALSRARSELDELLASHLITYPVYQRLLAELKQRQDQVGSEISQVQERDPEVAEEELRSARMRLITAEKSAIRRAAADGLISVTLADEMIEAADERLDALKFGARG